METARRGLDDVRKYKMPPENLCDRVVVGPAERGNKTKQAVEEAITSKPLNPFTTAFVVRNPTVPFDDTADKIRAEKEEVEIMKKINEGGEFDVFQSRRKYTLVVKGFSGSIVIQTAEQQPSVVEKIFGNPKQSSLDAGAKQAEEFAKMLKDPRMKLGLRPFVLHTRSGSYVCLGEFDSETDPALQEAKRLIAGTQLKLAGGTMDSKANGVGLLPNPLPMRIPGR